MRVIFLRRVAPLLFTLAALLFASGATAAITPESDVLLPWFEIDLDREAVALTTEFSVVNASPNDVNTQFTVYTNWGIPVLEARLTFERTEAKSIDLRAWIVEGRLPDRTLTAEELAHVQAALTGRRSPRNNLYHGTEFKGLAVGYLIARTLDDRPDSLFGDTYSVDLSSNLFEAETLQALTHESKADCKRHGIRFVNQGRLYEGSELIIWSGRQFNPSETSTPGGPKMPITISVYDQAGKHIQDCHRQLIAVEPLEICHLDITPPIGWLDVRTEDPTIILEHLHSTTLASAELHSYCLRQQLALTGPQLTLEKLINGSRTERGTAPAFAVGAQVPFEYRVTNSGTEPLNPVVVGDDTGIAVTCPKASLAAGESMTCTASATAVPCINRNMGTAVGVSPEGERITATDFAYYEGVIAPALTMKLLVNGNDANEPSGPLVDAGDLLEWNFVVSNTGDVRVTEIKVSGKKDSVIICPASALDPQESMTCRAESIAAEGQQQELGTAKGVDPCGKPVIANDPAHYFGRRNSPGIEIRKFIGENDANTPPGPAVPAGSTIEWRFIVTNTGNVPLGGIVITDLSVTTPSCPKTSLEPGESMTCTATSVALSCQQTNTAIVTGVADESERSVSDEDPAHYFGQGHPAITLKLQLNGDDADEPPGPFIDEGTNILLTYIVTNTGDVVLKNVMASDDHDRTATCPKSELLPGESMTCTATVASVAGSHDLYGSAYGKPPCGEQVQANDPAFYRGRAMTPNIGLIKLTNDVHAEAAPGPQVAVGSAVTWKYIVTNTGALPLTGISVVDDRDVTVACPKTELAPGETMTCTASGIALSCQYRNTATVTGQAPEGRTVSATDVSFYFGQPNAAIALTKQLNLQYTAAAIISVIPSITTGTRINWLFNVSNIGDIALTGVSVTDDRVAGVTCPQTTLAPGESMTCTATSDALAGSQRNTATATGNPACGAAVTATASAEYFGVTPSIKLEKLINGSEGETTIALIGSTALFSYIVTNTGNVALDQIALTDDRITTISCPKTSLTPAESMVCTASALVKAGMICNRAEVTGTSPQRVDVRSVDTACYTGVTAAISIEKSVNGNEADNPPGPEIPVGTPIVWTYVVTNTGGLPLNAVSVTDNQGVVVQCPKSVLAVGESMTCTASGTAVAGQYSNIGTASGTPAGGSAVTASDPAHYYGQAGPPQGCTPGYWKNHPDAWAATGYVTVQPLISVFTHIGLYPDISAATFSNALNFAGGPGAQGAAEILLRAGVAALLNASHPSMNYPHSAASVQVDVNSALATQNRDIMLSLAASLDAANNLGCPLN